jgi:hypothetical protein
MSAEHDDALEVLRAVWRGQGQAAADLAGAAEGKSCKRMSDVGFDDFADGDADLAAAWRAKLEREGKLDPAAGSIRQLVQGSAESRSR